MNLLVTGGCGFIGSTLIRSTLAPSSAGPVERVVNLDKLTYAASERNIGEPARDPRHVLIHGDIGDEALVERILAEHRIDAVINLAAETHVDRSIDGPAAFIETNVAATGRFLDAVLRHWRALPVERRTAFRLLQTSTDEVYGERPPKDAPCAESAAFAPNSPYAASKAAADHLVRSYHRTYGLPVLTTHGCNVYGPRQFPEKLVPLMILNALEGRPLPLYGDGLQSRQWLHAEDHAAALLRVLSQGEPGRRYNLAGRDELTNADLVRLLCARLDTIAPRADGRPHADAIAHVADRPGHDRRYAVDSARLRALGWDQRIPLPDGLAQTIDWYRANPEWVQAANARYQRQRLGAARPPS